MSEQRVENKDDVFRFLITVDGDVHSKFHNQVEAVTIIREVQGITNDEIVLHTIH